MLLEDLQVALKVAEFRNITAAAANLDMRTATASAALKRVESALGMELFIRTTRHLRLSCAGDGYRGQTSDNPYHFLTFNDHTKTATRRPPLFSAFLINYWHSAARAMRTTLTVLNSSKVWIAGAKPSA